MSSDESSPLLPQAETQQLSISHEHPIFLRVCHSQWTFLGQKSLLASRAAFFAYTAVVWAYTLARDVKEKKENANLFPFYAGNISLTMQMVYYMITTIWTAQHLNSPRSRPQRDTSGSGIASRFRDRAKSIVQIPRTSDWTAGRKFAFSVFYTSTATFPLVVTMLHWTILGDRHEGHWSGDKKRDWVNFSIHGVSAIIAGLEVTLLSSVRNINPFAGHAFVLSAISSLYFAWARLGHFLTGEWTYDQVNPEFTNKKGMFYNVVSSMALSVTGFIVVQGLHALRDFAAKKSDCDRST